MSFKEWLYGELVNDGIIDESEVDVDDITEEYLITSTDVEEADIENYKNQFKDYCKDVGATPDWDVDEE